MMINHTMVLTINGTRRSEKSGGLDDGEVSTFENKPGEYRDDLQTVEDLIEHINDSAYMRGEWISSMKLDGRDMTSVSQQSNSHRRECFPPQILKT
jgi:hypothetical protein